MHSRVQNALLTSYIGNAQHSYASLLDHAALVGQEGDSARHGPRGGGAIGMVVVAGVGARLVRSLLGEVSTCNSRERRPLWVVYVPKPWDGIRRW